MRAAASLFVTLLILVIGGGAALADTATDHCEMLTNEFPFAGRMTSMSDLASSCSVAGDGGFGINELYLSHNRKHLKLADPMCRLEFIVKKGEGKPEPAEGTLESHHYPHGLAQTFKGDGFECRGFTCFDALNTPVIHLELTADEEMEVAVSLSGHIPPRADALGEYEWDRLAGTLWLKRMEPRVDERDPQETFEAWAAVKPGFEVYGSAVSTSPVPLRMSGEYRGMGPEVYYRLRSKPVVLRPGTPHQTHVALTFSTREREFRRWAGERFAEVEPDISKAEQAARQRWNEIFRSAPKPATDDPELVKLYYHSIYVLRRNLHYPTGLFGTHHACFPSKDNYDAHWLWDAAFQAVGLAEFDLGLARDSILILTENQQPDGRIPHFVTVDWIRPGEGSQPPVVGWAAWKVYERSKDKEFLRLIYEPLVRNTDWWMKARDRDGDGLLEWYEPLESGWDNSPRWDAEYGKLESCDLNALVLMQMKIVADMADELGKADEARRWRSKADALGKRMVERLYQPDDNLFREIKFDTHEPVDILTPAAFMPLWAGVPLDGEKARAMIRDYLLSPRHFFGKVPFPIVAYSDPKYEAGSYWRGPTWINISYFMIETLVKYGFHDEAALAAKRLLDAGARNTYIHEYYNSQTGDGLAVREYGWTAAIFMEMLLGRYKLPEEGPSSRMSR